MSLNIVYDAFLSRLPHNRRTSSGWHSFNASCCHHRGHRPDRRKRGGIKFDGFVVVYHCFNCQYKTGWAPGSYLSRKTEDVLTWMGVSTDTINQIRFWAHNYRYTQDMGGFRAIIPHGLKSLYDLAEEGCADPRYLKIAAFLLDDDTPRDFTKWFWTPDDNDCGMSNYLIELEGTLEYPTAWWGFPLLGSDLPTWSHRGPEHAQEEDAELSAAEWKALEAEFDRENA